MLVYDRISRYAVGDVMFGFVRVRACTDELDGDVVAKGNNDNKRAAAYTSMPQRNEPARAVTRAEARCGSEKKTAGRDAGGHRGVG
jgi:hypothetical protein